MTEPGATMATVDDFREDLIFLRDVFPSLDRSFTAESRQAFDARLSRALDRVSSLTPASFAMEVAHALAAADNAHTMAVLVHRLGVAPLRLHWFADGLFIIRAADGPRELVGSRVVALQGLATETWLSRLRAFIGGNDARVRAMSVLYLSSPEALAAIEPARAGERLELLCARGDETVRTYALDPAPLAWNADLFPRRDPGISRVAAGRLPWRQVLDADVPLYLRDPDRSALHAIVGDDLLYVLIRRTADTADEGLESVLAEAIDAGRNGRVRHAVVDLRFNDGGNYVLALTFCRSLPAMLPPGGRVFVVTNNQTFSAGIVVAALVKYYSGAAAVVAGEAAGDRLVFWADGGMFELPRTRVPVRCATGFHDWEHGCRDPNRCAWFNLLYSVAAGSIDPVLPVATTFADYARGVDPVLDEIVRRLS